MLAEHERALKPRSRVSRQRDWVVEVDGAQHAEDPLRRWDDMERDIDLGLDGYQTLRFPA